MSGWPPTVDNLEQKRLPHPVLRKGKAEQLFHQVEARGLIRAGSPESELNQEPPNF